MCSLIGTRTGRSGPSLARDSHGMIFFGDGFNIGAVDLLPEAMVWNGKWKTDDIHYS